MKYFFNKYDQNRRKMRILPALASFTFFVILAIETEFNSLKPGHKLCFSNTGLK